ncbi:hypothetical protein [Nitrosomonas halophila]|uniref:Uncharacterized protein n=1 Tax=Nitrosomonas halophila TaxID=44576 RepID=A0A1H3IVN8_9PROT|nr:hypothetical protein [Nitrosomonas halophila]SDY31238.1 hypothetical protein SAMN05421881_102838 [Nitrosomonas halophila]
MVFPNRKQLGKRLGIKTRPTLRWIAALRSQRRQKTMAIRNFSRRLGEVQRAVASRCFPETLPVNGSCYCQPVTS